MRKIVYTRPDGGISVVHPVRNTFPKLEELSDAEIEQRAWDRLPASAINPQWVAADQIPADRTFRNAWKAGSGKVEHDMAKAREIHKENLRSMRAPLMAALDVEYIKADELGDAAKKAQIAAKKQALRDVTRDARITAAATPDELKAVIPEALK